MHHARRAGNLDGLFRRLAAEWETTIGAALNRGLPTRALGSTARINVCPAEITKLPLRGLNKVTNPIFDSLAFSPGGSGALVSCEFGHAESRGVELVWR